MFIHYGLLYANYVLTFLCLNGIIVFLFRAEYVPESTNGSWRKPWHLLAGCKVCCHTAPALWFPSAYCNALPKWCGNWAACAAV